MLDWLRELVSNQHASALGYALLGLAALIEYVFPPFPGDAVVLLGVFLAVRHGWDKPLTFISVLAGSVVGLMLVYAFGRWLHRAEPRATGWLARLRPRADALVERFRRRATWWLLVNRFLPSVRALFFLAAGMAEVPWWLVLVCGALSAAAWNAMLFAVGAAVGTSWERLMAVARLYSVVAWMVLGGVAASWLLVVWLRRRALRR